MSARDFEIVVVDDGSTDETSRTLASLQGELSEVTVVVVRNPTNLGISRARNRGIEAARGELIAFTDSDCVVEPDWLTNLIAPFSAPLIAATAGTVLDAAPRTWAELAYVGTCRIGRGSLQSRPLVGNNMCFRAAVLKEVGFEPALSYYADEDEIAWRLGLLGHRFAFAPAALVHHAHRMTIRGFLRQGWLQGVGAARYGFKRGFWISRDVLGFALAFAVAALAPLGRVWLFVALGLLGLQATLLVLNEILFKAKRVSVALGALPLLLLHNAIKTLSVFVHLSEILLGRQAELVRSKAAFRQRLIAPRRLDRQEAPSERDRDRTERTPNRDTA